MRAPNLLFCHIVTECFHPYLYLFLLVYPVKKIFKNSRNPVSVYHRILWKIKREGNDAASSSHTAQILKLLRSQRIDAKEPIPPGCVALQPVRQSYSYSVPSPHRLFKNSSTRSGLRNLWQSFLIGQNTNLSAILIGRFCGR
jgi:hypothetical protein